jgi:hypothetical protein
MNYSSIKELAKAEKCTVKDLIVLSQQNDPFYCGTDGDLAKGEWFGDLWRRFGYNGGVHIRRVHYQIISQLSPVLMPDGTPYENTDECWIFLGDAAKAARYLGLVDASAFVDRRNPEAVDYRPPVKEAPVLVLADADGLLDSDLPCFPDLPSLFVRNFAATQRYHLEVWAEKSTMNDVLKPLCSSFGAVLVTGLGELSVTATLNLVQRVIERERPARIFYVSDFDPAGQSMPVAASRKIEFFIRTLRPDLDVKVFHVVLTAEQVEQFQLPRTPIKKSERRAEVFEARFGSGAVELDALEAIHPGVLHRVMEGEMSRYFDRGLGRRAYQVECDIHEELDELRQSVLEAHKGEVAELSESYERLRDEYLKLMAWHKKEIAHLWRAITEELEASAPDIANYEIPTATEAEEREGVLFDSRRDYLTQVRAYKDFQGKAGLTQQ